MGRSSGTAGDRRRARARAAATGARQRHAGSQRLLAALAGSLLLLAATGSGAQGTPYLIKDINQTGALHGADHLLAFGDALLFAGRDVAYGWELWTSDGSEAGTVRVADIWPGQIGSEPTGLVRGDGVVFFAADDGDHGRELWRTDGTPEGTVLVADVQTGPVGSNPEGLMFSAATGLLYFRADDGEHGSELWASDGTPEGTALVADIEPGPGGSEVQSLTAVGTTIFFSAFDSENGAELRASDGTAGGTVLVADIRPGPASTALSSLVEFEGSLYFAADAPDVGIELFRSAGPLAGVKLVKDIHSGPESSFPRSPVVAGGVLYFVAIHEEFGLEIWRSDGTRKGTTMVTDLMVGPGGSVTGRLVPFDGAIYFIGDDGSHGRELFRTDGTAAGTAPVKDINPQGCSSELSNLTVAGDRLVFQGRGVKYPSSTGEELWTSDGTEEGTHLLKDIFPGFEGSHPRDIVDLSGTIFFTAIDGLHGRELWTSDGTEEGTVLVEDLFDGNAGAFDPNARLGVAHGRVVFQQPGDSPYRFERELWSSDGTAAGTGRVEATGMLAYVSGFFASHLGDMLYVWGEKRNFDFELWRTDLTPEGTTLVTPSLLWGNANWVAEPTRVGDVLFFVPRIFTAVGWELWKTDGATAELVKDIYPDGWDSNPRSLTDVAGTLFFAAEAPGTGEELWKSDGTEAGTVLVKDIVPGVSRRDPWASSVQSLVAVGRRLFFAADDGIHGVELWTSDGTEAGTVMVEDIFPGPESSWACCGTAWRGALLFTAYDPVRGQELWRSDGTAAGTRLVKDIYPGSEWTRPWGYTPLGDFVLFFAADATHGFEPWRTDGTPEGTAMIKDVNPRSKRPDDPGPSEYTVIGDVAYFGAADGVHGREIWKTDGTEAGTALVADINLGPPGSDPAYLVNREGQLFFTADDGRTSRELWALTCGNGVLDAAEECDRGRRNGGRQSCCRGDCTLQLDDADGDGIGDRCDREEMSLDVSELRIRASSAPGSLDGAIRVRGTLTGASATASGVDLSDGLAVVISDGVGVRARATWPADRCRATARGWRCRSAAGRQWASIRVPEGEASAAGGYQLRVRLGRRLVDASLAGPATVALTLPATIDRVARIAGCTGDPDMLVCSVPPRSGG